MEENERGAGQRRGAWHHQGEWIRIQLDIFAPPREEYKQADQGYGNASLAG